MQAQVIQILLTDGIATISSEMLIIVSAVVTVIVAFFVLKKGLHAIIHDQSLSIGGFYVRNTPYKGYNRFRSKSWNMKNTM